MAGEVEMVGALAGVAIFLVILWIFFAALGILAIIFWIFMLVDVAKRSFKNETDKVLWILVIVLAGLIGSIVYYFVVKRKKK